MKTTEPNQSLQTISCSVTVAAEPLCAPPHEMSDLKRSAKMKIRHYILIGMIPLMQIAWGGISIFWAVPKFPKPEAPKALDGYIATQPAQSESTQWLVSSSNELKRYNSVYGTLLKFGRSQSEFIFLSGFVQMICLVAAISILKAKKEAAEPAATDNAV